MNEIIRILEHFMEEEAKINEITMCSEDIEILKKSILVKVLRGELGTNDSNEESSLELLKEILSKKH